MEVDIANLTLNDEEVGDPIPCDFVNEDEGDWKFCLVGERLQIVLFTSNH